MYQNTLPASTLGNILLPFGLLLYLLIGLLLVKHTEKGIKMRLLHPLSLLLTWAVIAVSVGMMLQSLLLVADNFANTCGPIY